MAHDPKKVPDASPVCPRCHYFEQTAQIRADRALPSAWPLGIDQQKAMDILTAAFPDSYGKRRS
jgi:hypothetical protein